MGAPSNGAVWPAQARQCSPSGLNHCRNGGASRDNDAGAEGFVLGGAHLAKLNVKVGSMTGTHAGHLGSGCDVEMTDVEANDANDEAGYVSIGERSSTACAD